MQDMTMSLENCYLLLKAYVDGIQPDPDNGYEIHAFGPPCGGKRQITLLQSFCL